MAFPGTYNFSYYRGDTFEFRISPRNSDGTVFDLSDYEVAFTVSTARGESTAAVANRRQAYSSISADGSEILCAILPANAASWVDANQYVYDVEIRNLAASPYPKVYTLLTGTISVQEQITEVEGDGGESEESGVVVVYINPPQNVTLVDTTDTTVTITWDAPVSGTVFTGYVVGTLPPGASQPVPVALPLSASTESYVFTGLTPATSYNLGVVSFDSVTNRISNPTLTAISVTTLPSEESGIDSGESGLIAEPGVPTDFSLDLVTSSSLTFSWTAPTTGGTPIGYYVVANTSPDIATANVIANVTDGTSHTALISDADPLTPLLPETTYYFGIVAYNAEGPTLEEVALAYLANPLTAPVLIGSGTTLAEES